MLTLKNQSHATLAAVVAAINSQRSAELRLLTSQGWIAVGRVTVPTSYSVPPIGAVVAIQHLPGAPGSNMLYQPKYLGQRQDIEMHECIMAQLTHGITCQGM